MKCLNCLNFAAAHAFLTGWYLFTIFTVAPFWCTSSVILDFCFILLAFNTVIWASLVGAHKSKLEVEDFIFHAVVLSRETFQTLAWKFLLCLLQKLFRVYIFLNFVLVYYIVFQKLVKANPRRLNTFCLFLLFACNCSNLSKQEARHSY